MLNTTRILLALAAAALLSPQPTPAQQQPAVTDADIERARVQAQEQLRKVNPQSVEQVRQRIIVPQQKGANDEALAAERRTMPKLDALPTVQTKPNVDVGAMAGQFLRQAKGISTAELLPKPRLLVFVSMSMPADSLKSLVAQAERAQATLVLRGMVGNSLKSTGKVVSGLIGKRKVGFLIDPEAFDRYGVTHAPTFVLAKAAPANAQPCKEKSCTAPDSYALIAGDVSIDYALERIEQRAPRFKEEARGFLKRMRG